jgi:tRNA(adenine34) deaminase
MDLYLPNLFMEEIELFSDAYFMKKALQLAEQAYQEEEVPIGAVVVHEKKIIGKGYNQTELLKDVTAHAEMLAITGAAQYLGSKYLSECTLYVTIEPCLMCFGAIQWARVSKLIIGAPEPKSGFRSKGILASEKIGIEVGILEEECSEIMKQFFVKKRH